MKPPLVKVIMRTICNRNENGRAIRYHETLSCGHELILKPNVGEARQRRCKECAGLSREGATVVHLAGQGGAVKQLCPSRAMYRQMWPLVLPLTNPARVHVGHGLTIRVEDVERLRLRNGGRLIVCPYCLLTLAKLPRKVATA